MTMKTKFKLAATAVAAALACVAGPAARAGVGRGDQDRRHERHVGPVRRRHRPGIAPRRAHGGRGLRRRPQGDEGRGPVGRPPEQARRRLDPRPHLVRRRQGRRDLRRADLLGGSRHQPAHAREGQGLHQLRRGDLRPDGQGLLAQHHPLDLRHLDARQRHRQRDRQERRRLLVLPDRRLRVRSRPRARHRGGGAEERRQGARQGAHALPGIGLLVVPPAGADVEGEDHRPGQRRRRHHQLDQAGVRVRHRQGRPEAGRHAGLHLRHPRPRPEHRAGPDLHRDLLLGPERPDPRLDEALRRPEQQQVPDHGARRRVLLRAALPEGGRGGRRPTTAPRWSRR